MTAPNDKVTTPVATSATAVAGYHPSTRSARLIFINHLFKIFYVCLFVLSPQRSSKVVEGNLYADDDSNMIGGGDSDMDEHDSQLNNRDLDPYARSKNEAR